MEKVLEIYRASNGFVLDFYPEDEVRYAPIVLEQKECILKSESDALLAKDLVETILNRLELWSNSSDEHALSINILPGRKHPKYEEKVRALMDNLID